MHHFAIREDGPGRKAGRYFAYFNLPTNPICWLTGHWPKLKVTHYGRTAKNVWFECRVCNARYVPDPIDMKTFEFTGLTMREFVEKREANWEARPKEIARSIRADHGRDDFQHHRIKFGAELYAYRPTWARLGNVGFRLHTGTRGSETPFDAHLDLGIVAGYFQVGGVGGRFCEWLGRGHGRDISLSIHNGQLWWKLWYDGNSGNDEHHRCDSWRKPLLPPWRWGRRKHRPWMCLRDGNIDLNPVDAWFGSPKYHYEDQGEPRRALVTIGQFPGDEYTVDFTLRRVQRHRDHGPRWVRRMLADGYSFSATAHPGIPVRNHEWKGDEILGWGGTLGGWTPETGENWLRLAVDSTIASVKRDRKHHEYRPPSLAGGNAP